MRRYSAVFAAFLVIGCGSDPSGVDRVASDIVVVPSVLDLDQLETTQLHAYVVDQHGEKVTGASVSFATNSPGIVTVTPSGQVTANGAAGTGTITASFGTLARDIDVTVHPVATRIALLPADDLTLNLNSTVNIGIAVYDAADQQIFGFPFTVTSSQASVVSAANDGQLTTFGTPGTATLSIQAGSLQASATVRVADFHRQSLAGEPYGVDVSGSDVAYVAALSGPMGRINLPGFGIVSQVPVLGAGVAFSVSGDTAYIAGFWNSGIPLIDVANDGVDSLGTVVGTRFTIERTGDGQKVFVGTNAGLTVINSSSGASVELSVGSYVNHLSRHPTLPLMYGSQPDLGRVIEINTNSNAIARTFAVSGMAQAAAVSNDGSRLFIANEAANQMEVWNLVSNQSLPPVKNITAPYGLTLSPDGSKIYLSQTLSGQVTVVDAASLQILTVVLTGGNPRAIGFNQAGTVAVSANQAGWVDFLP
jgi:YVTN family beta-propeller protein